MPCAAPGAPRREIRLDTDDLIAGAQILAWIAMPHRPQSGVHLLEQWCWARRRYRGESVPILPYNLSKQSRITVQLAQFNRRVLEGFRAGLWFDRRCNAALPANQGPILNAIRSMGASTRVLARSYAARHGVEQGNAIRAIWSKRKPVLHLASATVEVLCSHYAGEDRCGFDLERMVFWPNWVSETIELAEQTARHSSRFGAFRLSDFYRFHRDSF
jgi:hypothetical protein